VKPERITSLGDPRADVFRNVRDADLRGRDGFFMAESEMVRRRLLRTPERLHAILLSEERFEKLREDLAALSDEVRVLVAESSLIHEIAAFHVHRGVLAAGYRLPRERLSLPAALGHLRDCPALNIVLAEGWTNVDNMGSLFRNAAAFGVDAIVLDPTCCDPLYRKSIRVSMGHALSIPYAVSEDWLADLRRLKEEWGVTLVGAECHPKAVPLWNFPRADRVAIVFGSEAAGLSQDTMRACDALVEIPMAGDVSSINVATSAAVFLYELSRGRSEKC